MENNKIEKPSRPRDLAPYNELKNLRLGKRLSQRELGSLAGVSTQTILNWENRLNDIPASKALFLCDYFGVTLDHFYNHYNAQSLVSDMSEICQKADDKASIEMVKAFARAFEQVGK
jgi:transcriptional regulator with XRE-family HTH domain